MASKDSSKASYVECFVFIDNMLPIGHAWLRNGQGEVLDGTTVDSTFLRSGIEIPQHTFKKFMSIPAFALEF